MIDSSVDEIDKTFCEELRLVPPTIDLEYPSFYHSIRGCDTKSNSF